jgi:hypothetical protein
MSWYRAPIEARVDWPRRLVIAIAAGVVVAAVTAGSATAATPALPDASGNYSFQTLNDPADTTFNQLLGINEFGTIAGYFGSGAKGHPNKGYTLPNDGQGGNYRNENFPGSDQTQVTGLNNIGVTVGFWVDGKGANFGFYATNGHHFHTADYPTSNHASPSVDQLLGVNDQRTAVGFYNDSKGNAHGYSYALGSHRYRQIKIGGASSLTATAINSWGDVAGFDTNAAGTVEGFVKLNNGHVVHLNVPGSAMTQAFGLNDGDEVVGSYTVGTGTNATTHGFIWAPGFGFQNVDDPNGVGATTVNGVNDHGRLVGFYTDSAGNTNGFLTNLRSG